MFSSSHPVPNTSVLQSAALVTAFFIVYLVLDRVSFIHPLHHLNITPWNPQPALAIALIALRGYRWVLCVFVTVLAAEFLVPGLPVRFAHAVVLSGILAGGYTGIAWLLRGPVAIAFNLNSRKDVLHLAAAVTVGAGATALFYVGALCLGGALPWSEFAHAAFRFWVGDSIGILVTLPLLLLLTESSRRRELGALLREREVWLQVGTVVALLIVVFAMEAGELFKYFYLLFLPLIWIAARHGLAASIVAVALIQAGVIVSLVVNGIETLTVIETQIPLLALAMTGLLLGVTVDEWRFASNRLARARQLTVVGEMATALAHELNQPLTALSTYADAIRLLVTSRHADNAALIDAAERIQRVATRSVDIVARFRSLGLTGLGRMERISLIEPLRAALAAITDRTGRVGAVVDIGHLATLPPILVDRDRMAFVFQNLLTNALDAIEESASAERKIAISVRCEGSAQMAISVRDTGGGIRPEMAERIFDPFYSGKAQGMGLGLALSRSIVESHGGRLWAEPTGYGLFHLTLPL